MKKNLLVALLLCAFYNVFSQVDTTLIYNTSTSFGTLDLRIAKSATRYYYLQDGVTFSFRESSPGVKTNTYRSMTSWNTSDYQQGNMREKIGDNDQFVMNYRMLFPDNYQEDYSPGYPIIIMFHGAGETGNCWMNSCHWADPSWNPNTNNPPAPTDPNHELLNNDRNLFHGASKHLDAVNLAAGKLPDDATLDARAFPGFVLFPQSLNGWQQPAKVEDAIRVLRLVIKKYNIDENRVYIHGLSNGGWGVNQAIKRAPWLFAAALTMSAVSDAQIRLHNRTKEVAKLPLWVFQGGQDTNPTPSWSFRWVKDLREAGAVVRYYNYPSLGHGTWNTAYKEPDFFSWILSQRKYNPHIDFGTPVICNTTETGVRMSFSEGFLAYQWEFNGEIISGANDETYVANQVGVYRGRFSRTSASPSESQWEKWSDPITVSEIEPAKPSVEIANSTHLRGPGLSSSEENNSVYLTSGVNAELYEWYKNGQMINFANTDIDDTLKTAKVTSAGNTGNGTYSLVIKNSYCPSPVSDPIYLYFNNSAPLNISLNASDVEFNAHATSSSTVFLAWKDKLNNETGYELWRRKNGGNFVFVAKTEKDAISYTDQHLEPSTLYEYKLRAINNSGRSNYVPSDNLNTNLQVTTLADTHAPAPPQNLAIVSNTIHSITIKWEEGSDETGIKDYVISYGSHETTASKTATRFEIQNLTPNTVYPITVRTRDYAGHLSQPSNQVSGTTYVSGLYYKHSTGVWASLDEPTCIATFQNPEFTGHVDNFTLTPRTQEDYFNFQFNGYINLALTGPHFFRVTSDDGSRLLIDGVVVVNNDGKHGNRTITSDTLWLDAGLHTIEAQYFDNNGNQNLVVQYKGPGIGTGLNFVTIPDEALKSGNYSGGTPPSAPLNLTASNDGMKKVNLSWEYSSDNESTDFEVFRSDDEDYQIVGRTETSSWTDTVNVKPGTEYQYKVRAVNNNGTSEFSNVATVTTPADNTPPSPPTDLVLQSSSGESAAISWTASSDNAGIAYYEIYQNGTLIGTTTSTSFTITDLSGDTYNITVVAVDVNDNKSESSAVLVVDTTVPGMFYAMASGSLNELSTWKDRQNGSGSSPTNFTDAGQTFVISNRDEATLTSNWTVSGADSKVILPKNVTLTLNAECHCSIQIKDESNLVINNAFVPNLLDISPTSTVTFNSASAVPLNNYGNLVLVGTGTKVFATGRTLINGNFEMNEDLALSGEGNNIPEIKIGGNMIIQQTDGSPVPYHNVSVIFADNALHNLQSANHIGFYSFEAESNARVNLQTGGAFDYTAGSTSGGGLILKPGSVFHLGNNNLKLLGHVNPNGETGQLAFTGGNLNVNSTAIASLYLEPNINTVNKITIENGDVRVNQIMNVTDGVEMLGGSLSTYDGNIRLISTAEKTAVIYPVTSGSISGSIRVQQYMNAAGDTWREFSSPLNGPSVSDIQQYFPVTGNFIGSTNGTSFGNAPSMFTSNGNYTSMTAYPQSGSSNSSPLLRSKGYLAYMHGYNDTTSITLEFKGQPVIGSASVNLTGGDGTFDSGWNLVGNPYTAYVTWDTTLWSRNALSDIIAIQESKIENEVAVTQYKYYDSKIVTPVLKPGQTFWIQATDENPVLSGTEDVKVDRVSSSEGSNQTDYIIIGLTGGDIVDQATLVFSTGGTAAYDAKYDSPKRKNRGMFNLSTSITDTLKYAVNNIGVNFCSSTIPVNIDNISPGSYSLSFSNLESLNGMDFTLTDKLSAESIDLNSQGLLNFEVTTDQASYQNRFELTLTKSGEALNTPDVSIVNACYQENAQVIVNNVQEAATYSIIDDNGSIIASASNPTEGIVYVSYDFLENGVNELIFRSSVPGCGQQVDVPIEISYSTETVADPVITQANDTLSVDVDAVYQWLKDGEVIDGATESFYYPTESGSYTVMVTNGTCSKISQALTFSITGVDADPANAFTADIYPNPSSSGNFIVSVFSKQHYPVSIEIVDGTGQQKFHADISIDKLRDGVEVAPVQQLSNGFYIFVIRQGNKIERQKVIVDR